MKQNALSFRRASAARQEESAYYIKRLIVLVEEVLPVQRVALGGAESRIADDAAEFFFSRAVRHACGSYYVFFEHHRAYVVAAEAQAHLADFQALRYPPGLHVEEVRERGAR